MTQIEINSRGNKVIRGLELFKDRYHWDFDQQRHAEGWRQYDTKQDASYFGVWVNSNTLQTFTYCEGDTALVECEDEAHFKAELEDMHRFYGDPPPAAVSLGDDGVTHYYDEAALHGRCIGGMKVAATTEIRTLARFEPIRKPPGSKS